MFKLEFYQKLLFLVNKAFYKGVKMAVIRQVSQLGHSVLRADNRLIEEVNSPHIQSMIDDMLVTVKDYNGVGIAAPQVYESYKIFIVASYANARYPYAPNREPFALINPEIISHSREMVKGWEGCLSVPGIRGIVPRYKSVTVKYITRDGKIEQEELHDFIARIFQHEYDHINGLVFLDRLESVKDIITEKEYMKLV
jgi:peptide deformylase